MSKIEEIEHAVEQLPLKIFVKLAVWDESDQWHRGARACFSELLACRADLVTSSFVLLECGNAAARRPYRSTVSRLRKQMEPGASSDCSDR
jgi:hypothetical protein